jgi:hypothetical protein
MKFFYVLLVFLFGFFPAFGQRKTAPKADGYSRNGLTYIFKNHQGINKGQVRSAMLSLGVPEHLDDNRIDDPIMDFNSMQQDDVEVRLQKRKVANQIIAEHFNRKDDGSFDMNRILQRGHYNASSDEIKRALAMERGLSALDQSAIELVGHSYILVMEVNNLISMKEYYDKEDQRRRAEARKNKTPFVPVNRVMKGYTASFDFQLFQLDFTDSIASFFYSNLWLEASDTPEQKAKRKAAFDAFTFPLTHRYATQIQVNAGISNVIFSMAGGLPGGSYSMSQLFQKAVKDFMDEVNNVIPKFKIRANVTQTKPVEAMIGMKEGLLTDQRFFVYENRINSKGKKFAKKRGVVRVKKVADNREAANMDVDATEFYQIAGKKLAPGMILEQHLGAHLSFYGGYQFAGEVNGLNFRFDYNISSMFAGLTYDGNSGTGLKVFLEVGADIQEYTSNGFKFYDRNHVFEETLERREYEEYEANFTFYRLGFGLAKHYVLKPNVFFAPELGWSIETAISSSMRDESNIEVSLRDLEAISSEGNKSRADQETLQYSCHYLKPGAQLILNIYYPVQVYGSVEWFLPVIGARDREGELISGYNWNEMFSGRNGLTFGAGIRIEF